MGGDQVEAFLKEMGAQKSNPLGFSSLADKVGDLEFGGGEGSLDGFIKTDFSQGIAHLQTLVEKLKSSPGGPCPDSSCELVKRAEEVLPQAQKNEEEFKRQ